jgi:hypothetical protein
MRITAVASRTSSASATSSIRPEADRVIILIGGKNAQGKSSALDALTVAFGGKRAAPADPVRHGADEADIDVELDGGALTITARSTPDGDSKLEVREKGSVIRSPQARLDKLVGARFLDPIAFLQLSATDQRGSCSRCSIGTARSPSSTSTASHLARAHRSRPRAEEGRGRARAPQGCPRRRGDRRRRAVGRARRALRAAATGRGVHEGSRGSEETAADGE